MRKILVGLIAAMMLFAFTACEQQMPKYPASEWDLEIAKVTFVSSATTFREGDTALNAVPVTVNVEYKNGDTTNGVVASLSTTEALVGGENIGTVDINGDSTADALVTFNAIEKTGLTINTDEATLSVKESEISIDPDNSKDSLEGITVTLTYADGYTVPAGDSWTSSWNGTTAASTTGAVVSYDGEEAIVEFTVTDRKPVAITALSAEYTDEETIVGEAFNASHVEVTATYSDGSSAVLPSSNYTLNYYSYTFADTDVASGIDVVATLNKDVAKDASVKTATAHITVVADYVTAMSVAVKTDPAQTFVAGTAITANQFTFTATRMAQAASVPENLKTIADSSVTIDPATTTPAVGYTGSYTVNFWLTADPTVEGSCTVTVTAPQA